MSGFDWKYMESFLQSGVLEFLDGVSVHPYRDPNHPPETAATDYKRLRELIDRCAPESKRGKIPILSGEWGYASNTKGVSLETQAAFAVRQQLCNLLNGVPLSIWYDWKNDGHDPADNEQNFGTVKEDLEPKPAYTALKTMTAELSGYRLERRLDGLAESDFVLVFVNGAGARKAVGVDIGGPACRPPDRLAAGDFPGAWAAPAICGDGFGDALRRSGHQRPAGQLVRNQRGPAAIHPEQLLRFFFDRGGHRWAESGPGRLFQRGLAQPPFQSGNGFCQRRLARLGRRGGGHTQYQPGQRDG